MKKRFLTSLQPLASRFSLQWLIQLTGQRLFLPFYHSVQQDISPLHLKHLYQLRDVHTFEKDIDYLLKHYRPIDLSELFNHVQQKKPFEENRFFLSFDDGLRAVYDWVEPILTRKGVPATIFLNSAFVDNRDLFFRYKASVLVEYLAQRKLSEKLYKELEAHFKSSSITSNILSIKYQDRHLIDQVAAFLELDFNVYLKEEKPYLTTTQIHSLQHKGFTFGSHSVDHPLYSDLTLEEQIRQTRQSQEWINTHFPQSVKAFAFPFTDHGVSKAYFDTIQTQQIADLSFGTAGLKQDTPPRHLQRFPVEEFPYPIHELVPAEYFYYFGKSILGKNRINRT